MEKRTKYHFFEVREERMNDGYEPLEVVISEKALDPEDKTNTTMSCIVPKFIFLFIQETIMDWEHKFLTTPAFYNKFKEECERLKELKNPTTPAQ